eukprot:TRINITY_DN6990_c0_g1_i1.p1 TRINITY_DN6990_c0_g1~~TRINITY_DN6990_c0_g1_i1.p1  ORF type:complete len:399 (-),score=66.83 TRINITY_DN6990_c0_g1_i1:308-1378(-)
MSYFTRLWRISSQFSQWGRSSRTRSFFCSSRSRLPSTLQAGNGTHPRIATPYFLSLAWFAATSSSPEEGTEENSGIHAHFQDLEEVYELLKRTLSCKDCGRRKIISDKVDGIEYCSCSSPYYYSRNDSEERLDWTPFLEQTDIIVWRKPHPKLDGLYAYKMYGRFHDVSPREFLEAQLDISEFRKSWDTSTVECRALSESSGDSGMSLDQIYYWEVVWPKFFANRDYVCQRRVRMREDSGRIVVYTEAVDHPDVPRHSKKFRVEDYVSILTIQGSDLDTKGLEFTLTAFENPGLSLPTSITTWVAMRGLPQYIQEMRRACLQKKSHQSRILLGAQKQEANKQQHTQPQHEGTTVYS